jgi:hypothetical protein
MRKPDDDPDDFGQPWSSDGLGPWGLGEFPDRRRSTDLDGGL